MANWRDFLKIIPTNSTHSLVSYGLWHTSVLFHSYEYGWILVQKVEEGKLTDKMAWNTRMQGKKIEWVDITSELKF